MVSKALFSSARVKESTARDDWQTPDYLFNYLQARYKLVLDVAAAYDAFRCPTFFTIEQDGLSRSWYHPDGQAWCNPPYSTCGKWLKHGAEEAKQGNGSVFLIPARTDTKTWHTNVIDVAQEIIYCQGRITFVGASFPAPFPSAIIIYGPAQSKGVITKHSSLDLKTLPFHPGKRKIKAA